jgi:hypothetical protein
MPESTEPAGVEHVASAASASTPERTFGLRSLQPGYREEDHGLYARYIRHELNKPARRTHAPGGTEDDRSVRPRNIALTGGYGAGKSSILSRIVSEFGNRVVSVSLSTLGSEEVEPAPVSSDPGPLETSPVTNAIQKEIVKQLLYREKPSKVPGSRYRRIEGFRHGRALALSALVAAGMTGIAFLAGWLHRIEQLVGNNVSGDSAVYASFFILSGFTAYCLQRLFHNRLRIEKLGTGPASVSLTDKSESYFDKYLDEIVYFFEATEYDIVIFEDIDRFNDPYIFETLRELNTLLNNSKQVQPKAVTFIYAIKDSIFEQLGKISINGVEMGEEEIAQLAVTNRTKFFDVVIPVVPFISHRNARDLVSKQMKASGFVVDPVLADLVAKHLVDMRLIKNIHNEFAVFQQKILGPQGVAELDAQTLFAMVVYKNLYMADFEKIKEGTSNLDGVFEDYRAFVNREIRALDEAVRVAEGKIRKINSIETRSKVLGDRLDAYIERVLKQGDVEYDRASLTLASAVTREDLRKASFWKEWLEDEELVLSVDYIISVTVNYYGGSVQRSLKITRDDAKVIVADQLLIGEWEKEDVSKYEKERADSMKLRGQLKHASMKDVAALASLASSLDPVGEYFSASIRNRLGDGLAAEMIEAGYIDRNFSLYVALYYDDTVTVPARNYLIHSVEADVMDVNAEIGSESEIEAMLIEAGPSILGERSIFNVQIFDYLLGTGDKRLETPVSKLASGGRDEREFITSYLANGLHADRLVALLAPAWADVLVFLSQNPSVSDSQRLSLIDWALASLSEDISYATTSELGAFVQEGWRALGVLTRAGEAAHPNSVIDVLSSAGTTFDVLSDVSPDLVEGVVARGMYSLNVDNLTVALAGEANLSLNRIRAVDANVFEHVTAHLAEYIEIQAASPSTEFAIDEIEAFVPTINELADNSTDQLRAVVTASTDLTITNLSPLVTKAWPLVAETGRLTPSFSNVTKYLEEFGAVDDALAATLNEADSISKADEADDGQQRKLALALINSSAVIPGKRIELARGLEYDDTLVPSEVDFKNSDPDFVGEVLAAGLVADSSESFGQLADLAWAFKRSYVLRSSGFKDYLDEVEFSPSEWRSLVEDSQISNDVKAAVLARANVLSPVLAEPAMSALAEFALSTAQPVSGDVILAMAKSGVKSDLTVRLMAAEVADLSLDELIPILRVLPKAYVKLAGFNGHTKVPNTEANVQLVDRLIELDQVSSRDPNPRGEDFRVNLKRGA